MVYVHTMMGRAFGTRALAMGLVLAGAHCGDTIVDEAASGSGSGTGGVSAAGGASGSGAAGTGAAGSGAAGTGAAGTSTTTGPGGAGTATSTGSGAGTTTGMGTSVSVSSSGVTSSSGSMAASSSAGTGGSSTVDPCGGGPGTLGWLDSMDNGSSHIDPTDGRKGTWYTFNDGSEGGVQTPPAGGAFTMTPAPASAPLPLAGHKLAVNSFGKGFNDWGAAIGVDLNNDGITYAAYDASKFQGICLWARVGPNADTGGHAVRFEFLDGNTTPAGGVCNDGGAATNACYDGFGATLQLDSNWRLFKLTWADLAQEGWGQLAPAVASDKLYSMDFETGSTDAFDTWLFGLEFF
jgi:hypothetical protein